MSGGPEAPKANRRPAIGGDRDSLGLAADQIALLRAIASANPRTIVIVIAGSAVLMNEWIDEVPAVLQTFYSGMEGGRALPKLLFGEESPSGKLPFTVPDSADDLPPFDKNADAIEYGPYHGYTLMEKSGRTPAFAFGFGLAYSRFEYRALKVRRARGIVEAEVSIRNIGEIAADEIAELYIGFPNRIVDRPKKLLRGFERARLNPGGTRTIRFNIPVETLRYFDPVARTWRIEPGTHVVYVGGSSREQDLIQHEFKL